MVLTVHRSHGLRTESSIYASDIWYPFLVLCFSLALWSLYLQWVHENLNNYCCQFRAIWHQIVKNPACFPRHWTLWDSHYRRGSKCGINFPRQGIGKCAVEDELQTQFWYGCLNWMESFFHNRRIALFKFQLKFTAYSMMSKISRRFH